VVLGAPAEQAFGAKIDMVKTGVFEEIDVAMIVHPNTRNMLTEEALACSTLEAEFFGRPPHPAGQPHKGVNALDAMILAFMSINSLRQHIRGDAHIHRIITDGGEASNIASAHSAAVFLVRALDDDYLAELKDKLLNCFAGTSIATGQD
jgi:metal-dependent amidase/aminoacylase/carboxypeptidase family protein